MNKKKLPLKYSYRLLNHGPTVLISTILKGKPNIMPIAWQTPIDFEPPKFVLIIGDHSHTFKTVKQTKTLVINIPSADLIDKVYGCGKCSGRDVNKFERFKLTPLPAKTVNAPLIKECIGHIECKVIDMRLADKYNIFIVEGTHAWVEKGCFKDIWLTRKSKTLHHLSGRHFSVAEKTLSAG